LYEPAVRLLLAKDVFWPDLPVRVNASVWFLSRCERQVSGKNRSYRL